MGWEQLPTLFSAVGTVAALLVTLYLGLRKDTVERRSADDEAGDRLRDDLIALFEAQNRRLAEQDARLTRQQEIIDRLQSLVDNLREGNRELQAQKHALEVQNLELMAKLELWERRRQAAHTATERGNP